MKRFAGAVLILALAACSKQEPSSPAVEAPAASKTVGAGLPRDKSGTDGGHGPPLQQASVTSPDPAATAALLKQGEAIFDSTCATCHMVDGGGVPNMQPSIIGSAWISNPDPQPLLSLILRGSAILGAAAQAYSNDMAPQDHLTDAEVAAIASYVRQRFAATQIGKPVSPAEAAVARKRPGLPE